MFALLALICFLLALFGGTIGSLNLVTLGFVFISAALLFGNWPVGYVTSRFRSSPPS